MSTENKNTDKNPWLGLEPYKNGQRLYGRDVEIEDIVQKIDADSDMVLYGRSGIGKSSIINAGVLPILIGKGYTPVIIRLSHKLKAASYQEQIRVEIGNAGVSIKPIPGIEASDSLWSLFHHNIFEKGEMSGAELKLLIIFDQFEEIFTLQRNEHKKRGFFDELTSVLNNIESTLEMKEDDKAASPKKEFGEGGNVVKKLNLGLLQKTRQSVDNGVHFLFTMREDSLSDFDYYTAEIPTLRHHRYGLRQINDEQAGEIIMSPQPGLVSSDVAELIIQKVTGRKDFKLDGIPEIEVDVAILSLYLERLYKAKTSDVITAELVEEKGQQLVETFYEECVSKIPAKVSEYLEDVLLNEINRRENRLLKIVKSNIDKIVTEQIDDIHPLDVLVKEKLLRTYETTDGTRVEYIHDILCDVVKKRKELRGQLRQQEEERKRLQEEEDRRLAELEEAKRQEIKMRRRTRKLWSAIIILLLIFAAGGIFYWDGYVREVRVSYRDMYKRYGWFEGFDRLTEDEASYLSHHYVLVYKGRMAKHPYRVEARDGYGELTANHNMGVYILNQFDDSDEGGDKEMVEKLKTVCQWELIENNEKDFVIQERGLDKDGHVVYCYNRTKTNQNNVVVSSYSDEDGFPIVMRDSTYFMLRTTSNEQGLEVLQEYFDDHGTPIPNKDGAYQTRWTWFDNGLKRSEASLFVNGMRMIDRAGNCGWIHSKISKDSLRVLESTYFDADSLPCRVISDSTIITRYEYDEHGRRVLESNWLPNGKKDINKYGVHAYKIEYNRHGQMTHIYRLNKAMEEMCDSNGLSDIHQEYDEKGRQILTELYRENEHPSYIEKSKYDSKGKKVEYDQFRINEDRDTIYEYKIRVTPTENGYKKIVYDYGNEYAVARMYDDHDNQIEETYYEIDCITRKDVGGYNRVLTKYSYKGDVTQYISEYFDINDERCTNDDTYYSVEKITVDSIQHSISVLRYDTSKKFLEGYRNVFLDKEFNKKISQESIDSIGNNVKTYRNGQFYYQMKIIPSAKPSAKTTVGFYAANEFGEPSYVTDGDITYNTILCGVYYDYNGTIINEEFIKDMDQTAFVELKALNDYGFKSGDILLACNDWKTWFRDENMREQYYGDITFSSLNWWNNETRHFLVARFNKDRLDYDIIEIVIPKDCNIKNYLNFNINRITPIERSRFEKILGTLENVIMLEPSRENGATYKAGIRKPVILLKYNSYDCTKEIDSDGFGEMLQKNMRIKKQVTYYDETDKKIHNVTLPADSIQARFYFKYVTETNWQAIKNKSNKKK